MNYILAPMCVPLFVCVLVFLPLTGVSLWPVIVTCPGHTHSCLLLIWKNESFRKRDNTIKKTADSVLLNMFYSSL